MKKLSLGLGLLAISGLILTSGCSKTERTLGGAAIGAGTGALIGGAAGGGGGAAIGAGVGALGGAAIGAGTSDRRERRDRR